MQTVPKKKLLWFPDVWNSDQWLAQKLLKWGRQGAKSEDLVICIVSSITYLFVYIINTRFFPRAPVNKIVQ